MRLIRLFKRDLARESAAWVEQGLISRPQAESICAHYGVEYDPSTQFARGYGVLVALGYLFIALALITLIGANWESVPRGLRMGGLLALTTGVNGYAVRAYVQGRDRSAELLFFLGGLFYGASIILIAQIYHLGEHMPDGVFWWALGTAPAAILLASPLLAVLTMSLALIWFLIELDLGFYSAAFPLFIAVGAYVLWRGRQSVWLFLIVVGSVGMWLEATMSAAWSGTSAGLSFHAEQLPLGIAYFILAYAVSHWLFARASSAARDYGTLLSLWTLRFLLLSLFVFSYHAPWRRVIEAQWTHEMTLWPVVAGLSLLALALGSRVGKTGAVAVMSGLNAGLFAVVASLDAVSIALYLQVLSNLALVGLGIGLIAMGVRDGESQSFFLGVATILLLALLRYIDLIGDYVGAAVLFIVMAGVLLGAARFWRSQDMKGSVQ